MIATKAKSKTVSPETSTPHRCPACESERHSDLFGAVTREGACRVNGREARGVTISRTKCLDCGQCYLIREPLKEPVAT
jgi:hypothetical protein